MGDVLPSQLANSIMGKLYDVLTNGDETTPKSEDNFFTWCTPGIPFEANDFDFLSQGLTGVVKKAALSELVAPGETTQPSGEGQPAPTAPVLTPELMDKLLAQDVGKLYMQAENFARLVDFVPDVSGIDDRFAKLNVMNNEGSLSDRYEYTLRMSQVMQTELPEETKKKIEKFRALLSVKKIKKNLIDDSETEVLEPSPLVVLYNEKLKAYEDAALEYNARRIDALAGDNPKAVHYWAVNASTLRNRVKAAMNDWVTNGYKNDYEAIAAFIDQVMQRDMTLLKAEYRDALEKAKLTGLASGSDFYYTSVVPGNFVKASGWTQFSFGSTDISRYSKSSHSKWSAGGGFNIGLFSIGGHAGGSKSHYEGGFDNSSFRLSFSMTQVPIVRPWLKSAYLASKAWRFDQSNPEAKGQMISDGGKPPKGMIPAYPTAMICVKDLELSMSNSSGMHEFTKSSIGGGGFVGYGPFAIGGNYQKGKTSSQSNYHWDGQTMKVEGMQCIGYKCHILPKCPDPLPTITQWV